MTSPTISESKLTTRLPVELREKVTDLARERLCSSSVILREALLFFFSNCPTNASKCEENQSGQEVQP